MKKILLVALARSKLDDLCCGTEYKHSGLTDCFPCPNPAQGFVSEIDQESCSLYTGKYLALNWPFNIMKAQVRDIPTNSL